MLHTTPATRARQPPAARSSCPAAQRLAPQRRSGRAQPRTWTASCTFSSANWISRRWSLSIWARSAASSSARQGEAWRGDEAVWSMCCMASPRLTECTATAGVATQHMNRAHHSLQTQSKDPCPPPCSPLCTHRARCRPPCCVCWPSAQVAASALPPHSPESVPPGLCVSRRWHAGLVGQQGRQQYQRLHTQTATDGSCGEQNCAGHCSPGPAQHLTIRPLIQILDGVEDAVELRRQRGGACRSCKGANARDVGRRWTWAAAGRSGMPNAAAVQAMPCTAATPLSPASPPPPTHCRCTSPGR